MAEDLGERTEEATPKKRTDSRRDGKVARSQDFTGAIVLLGGTALIWAGAWTMLTRGTVLLGQTLEGGFISEPLTLDGTWPLLRYVTRWSITVVAPLLLGVWLVAAVTQFSQIGWLFSPKVIQPKLSKLNPISGAQRIFGISGLVKVTLDVLKVIVVVLVVVHASYQHANELILLVQLPMMQAMVEVGALMLDVALRVLVVLLILGVVDLVYQRWKYAQDLKMTKQEVRDELKQTEGDPETKRRRMRVQQQIAMQRIGTAVPKADVIVTNPTHLSIAIRYDSATMAAPTVVAKGADLLAMRIRQLALQHGIPIVERKPLARTLYKTVDVNQEIPPDLYQAVAEILAYVYRLEGRVA